VDPKILWKFKGFRIAKTILKKRVGGLTPLSFKTYYKTTAIKAATKENRDNWISSKFKTFVTPQESEKTTHGMDENIANPVSNIDLNPEYIKNFYA
jgi:hypothetical protein